MAVSNLPLGHDISGSDMLRADKNNGATTPQGSELADSMWSVVVRRSDGFTEQLIN